MLPLKVDVTLEPVTCGGCGVTFAIPSGLYRRYVEDGLVLGCPNKSCPWGGMVRTKTKVQKLEEKMRAIEAARERAEKARRWAEQARDREHRSHIATRGHLTRAKRRAGAGVCPCCHRSFKQLRRHMKTKHPDFNPETPP